MDWSITLSSMNFILDFVNDPWHGTKDSPLKATYSVAVLVIINIEYSS